MAGDEILPGPGGEVSPIMLAIDPGRFKCGYALVRIVPGSNGGWSVRLLQKGIIAISELPSVCQKLAEEHSGLTVIMGAGTGSAAVRDALIPSGIHVDMVDEGWTTRRARDRYFLDNPPRSWRRLVPRGLLSPPGPVDDYAALLIAEDWAAAQSLEMSPPLPASAGPKGRANG